MQNAAGILRSNKFRANFAAFGFMAVGAWLLSRWIITGEFRSLIFAAAILAGILIFLATLQDWRRGLYLFLIWLVFEDLIRKFTGNSTGMFFVKDIIAGMVYLSMFAAWHRRRLSTFSPRFGKWLLVFVGLGVIQIFNPNSPNLIYGLLGFKLYFFYVPMMYAGYAYLRDESDLLRFLRINMWIAIVVGGLGIAQSVLGLNFLNPVELAPELQNLGRLVRVSPLTHVEVPRPTSVFVSDGRFAQFLTLMYLLAFGAVGYAILRKGMKSTVFLAALAVSTVATVMTGSRSAFIALVCNSVILVLACNWGISAGARRHLRLGRAVRRIAMVSAVAIVLAMLAFPSQVRARWVFYVETLSPASSASEFGYRVWNYPIGALESVFAQSHWKFGNGIGTSSLGTQYVSHILDEQRPPIGAESGYGELILELGIIGPFLWLVWTGALCREAWNIVEKLRHHYYFPLGFALLWFVVYILVIYAFYGIVGYENYVSNVYVWLSVGILFRLPALVAQNGSHAANHS